VSQRVKQKRKSGERKKRKKGAKERESSKIFLPPSLLAALMDTQLPLGHICFDGQSGMSL
jgi:hypothetical protein